MPRKATTNITNVRSVDLTKNFTATTASGTDHTYNVSSDLRLFLRFGSAITNLASYTSNDTITIAYEAPGSLETSSETVGARTLSSFFAEENKSNSATVTFSGASSPEDNITTFGNGSTDTPFSISFWIKYTETPPSGARILFEKGRNSGSVDQEYRLEYNNVGNTMIVRLFDDSSSRQIVKVFGSIDLEDGQFHHIAVTYDGHGSGAHNSTHITLYLDGEDLEANVSTRTDSGYTAMEPASDELHIGADNNASTESDAYTAEFAIWGTELTSDNIKAIYHGQFDAIETIITYNSGYTDLSSRIKIRDMDNRPGCYPTKHRMGDKDRSGKANIFYEDLPIQFGNRIKDDFIKVDANDLITNASGFDSSKWSVSTGMTIRREVQTGNEGAVVIDRCATFSGNGTGGKRFIRTAKALRNITRLYFELIQGPYNEGAILLNLRKGDSTETLKLQISTDSAFTSPTTIATYTPDPAFGQFFGDDYEVNTPPRKKVTLSLKDFPDLGQNYYLRFVQETFISTTKNVWAIPIIEIEYANQNIRYPLLLNHATGHNKFVSASISTPHTDSDMSGIGRAVKGVSDVSNPFQGFSEIITAFDETLTTDITNNFFRSPGIESVVYPGFSSPVKSKTKHVIDLSVNEETTIGYVNRTASSESGNYLGNDTSKIGQPLMCFWNKINKRWERVGKNVSSNNRSDSSIDTLKAILTSSCVGFGPMGEIGTSPDPAGVGEFYQAFGLNELDAPENLQTFNKPITQFSFPFGPQYHATGSQYILAKDVGITKPFLLEKCSLKFESKFEIAKSGSIGESETDVNGTTHGLFKPYASNQTDGEQFADRSLYIITPTFFMLRQFNDNYENKLTVPYRTGLGLSNQDRLIITSELPVFDFERNQGTHNAINIHENREMITYGQVRLFITSSDAFNASHGSDYHSSVNVEEMIDGGLNADLNLVRTHTVFPGPGGYPGDESVIHIPLTESLSMNFLSRNIGQYSDGSGLLMRLSNIITNQGNIALGKTKTTRGVSSMKSSRAIVNGFASVEEATDVTRRISPEAPLRPGSTPGLKAISTPTLDSLDVHSPYLIMPGDKLVFGWQYPIAQDHSYMPGTDSQSFNSMTLFGKSKLYLYGSEIVENKEFHESVNQNLTSCAVYEHIIGDEKVVDQWQVAYRGELTGSVIGQTNFGAPGMTIHTPLSTTYAYAYSPDFVTNTLFDFVNNENTTYRVNNLNKGSPVFRIGLFTFTPSKGFESFDEIPGVSTNNAKIFYNFAKSSEKHLRFRDQDRIYEDSRSSVGNFYDDSSYGTLIRTHDLANTSQNIFKDTRPKYRFNYRHFGHYADMLQQGKDSKFKVTPRQGFTTGYDIVVNSEPPVEAKLVEKEISEEGVISYIEKPNDYFLNFFYFQSSNLNQYMTSSMPFIDNDTATNRTYVGTEYIGFNAVSVSTLLS